MTLRIAVIGCGKIADQHLATIQRIPGSAVVAVCDRERRMAEQLALRFGIDDVHDSVQEMLDRSKPDVVHITTPPQSHLSIALDCLTSDCHVYIEKPFTVDANQARLVIDAARHHAKLVTAGYNYQFTPEMIEMRRRVSEGYLGGAPVHLESYWSYDLGDASYVMPLLGSPDHWVRRLPGQLAHNIVCHGVARLSEFLANDITSIHVSAHQSDGLRALGGAELMDEIRVLIRDSNDTTAFFCFSTSIAPGLNRFRVCGRRNSIEVDQTSGTVVCLEARGYKSYLTFVLPPLVAAHAQFRNAWRNLVAVVRRRRYHDSGLKDAIAGFHRAVVSGSEPPLPYREILLTAEITDAIFAHYRARLGQTGSQRSAA